MNNLLEYLVKSGAALAVLYFFYWIFLRNDTHFMLNRAILLSSLLLSLVLPFVSLSLFKSEPVIPTLSINFGETATPATSGNPGAIVSSGWSFRKAIAVIYASGALLVLLRLVYQAIYMQALSRLSRTKKLGEFTLVYMEKDIVPFSYFNKIYIPLSESGDKEIRSIIDHEKSHLQQYHFIDLFIAEFITIIQWFNPFAWFYEKSIKEIHEYLADSAVLGKGYPQGQYQALLVNQAMGGPVFTITNPFNQSLIKKRIIMMTKTKSPRLAQLKAFLLLPVVAVLIMAFAKPETILSPQSSNSVSASEEITVSGVVTNSKNEPIAGANVIIKGSTSGVTTDMEGNYRIKADKNDVFSFSFVGYKSKEIPVNGQSVINVQLEWNAITIDFSQKNSLIAGQNTEIAPETGKNVYVVVEEIPSYPGGTDALKKFIAFNLQYPAEARNKKIEGKVIVNFIVNEEGKVTQAEVMRGTAPSLDKEAMRVTNLITGWVPAKQNGKSVACRIIMPVEFKL